MPETAEQMAERWETEIMAAARAEVALAFASDPEPFQMTDNEVEAMDLGITAGFVATMRQLVREGILPSDRNEDRA